MKLHRYEKIWLTFGVLSLIVFLSIVGISAFKHNNHPSGGLDRIDPKKVHETAPFDNPGVRQIDEDTYEVSMIALTFGYKPNKIEVPVGKEIIFKVTSPDVTHSFSIVNTKVNMMVVPGHINEKRYTFEEPGSYLVLCNEYCGTGHEFMTTTIEVVEQ